MKSKIVLFFTIIVCFLLQSTLLQKIAIGSITPNLLLILCVSMGLMRGRKSGLWTGFFSGYTFRIYYDDDIKVPMALTAIMDLIYNLAVYGLQFFLRGRLGIFKYLYRIIIPEIFYTVFLALIVYKIFYYINHHFMNATRKERESIWVLK